MKAAAEEATRAQTTAENFMVKTVLDKFQRCKGMKQNDEMGQVEASFMGRSRGGGVKDLVRLFSTDTNFKSRAPRLHMSTRAEYSSVSHI